MENGRLVQESELKDQAMHDAQHGMDNRRKRFDVYLVGAGWNTPISRAIRENLGLFACYLDRHNLYVLSEAQSTAILKKNPMYIGSDPIVMVIDRDALKTDHAEGYGFRMNLGTLHDPAQVVPMLKLVLRIVSDRRAAPNIMRTVRKIVHKEGLLGTIEIIAESGGFGHAKMH